MGISNILKPTVNMNNFTTGLVIVASVASAVDLEQFQFPGGFEQNSWGFGQMGGSMGMHAFDSSPFGDDTKDAIKENQPSADDIPDLMDFKPEEIDTDGLKPEKLDIEDHKPEVVTVIETDEIEGIPEEFSKVVFKLGNDVEAVTDAKTAKDILAKAIADNEAKDEEAGEEGEGESKKP